jgi:hypothetical protein
VQIPFREKIIEKEPLLGIDRLKTRHFRKDGMTLAQIVGIVKDAVIWMSGHSNERCNKSYFSSLSGPAMKYNAGFFETPKEMYYVPRARIVLPEVEGQVWLQKLGPFLGVFRTSVERMGDETHCAELDFVNEILPQLLLVALQDGVHFVGDVKYRNKPWATFRVDLLVPNYEQWALEKYAWARAEEKLYNESRCSNNWESIMTGDFLHGDTMENKDEVMEGMKRKHHSLQLTKVNQRVSSSKMPPAPPPILIPATPHHPSTPRRKLVPLLPRQTRLSNTVALSLPLVEC